jgi:nucleoside-diphosphate-sugar epimerase
MSVLVALTGATGFVGGHVAATLVEHGHRVRALVRRDDPALRDQGVELRRGDLDGDPAPFLDGADAVVHVAGAVRAASSRAFHAVNADATARLAAAAVDHGVRSFILVSSLAARMPEISPYAASKAAGEVALLGNAGAMHVTIVRPPAVYGPADRATLPLLRGLARGLLLYPGHVAARFSLLYAPDLAALVPLLLARPPAAGTVLEPDDGQAGGYAWRDLGAIAQARLRRPVRTIRLPRAPLSLIAWAAEGYGRYAAHTPILSRGKVAELYHRDWVSDTRAIGGAVGWAPRVDFADGLVSTLGWYRQAGWL